MTFQVTNNNEDTEVKFWQVYDHAEGLPIGIEVAPASMTEKEVLKEIRKNYLCEISIIRLMTPEI